MSSPEAWRSWEGRVVDGKFPLRQWLGASDHSAVFLTEWPQAPSQKAVIKLVAAGQDSDRLLAQWRVTAQLTHPNLIRLYEAGRWQSDRTPLLYLVMEHAEENLAEILPQRSLTLNEVSDLLPPLLDALAYLHAKGFVHGRIKPSNVLAVGDQLKLSTDQVTPLTETSIEKRRRDVYDPPEAAAGILSPAGDLWSVGVTLVAALTQNVAFKEETPSSGPGLPESIPEPFRGIARECLHLDPARRCSIAEIKARLQPPARSVPAPPEAVPASRHPRSRGAVTAAVLGVAILVSLIVFYSGRKSEPVPTSAQTTQPPGPVAEVRTPTQPALPAKKAPDSAGEVVQQVLPDVPQSAKRTITGTIKVAVRVEVDSTGKVTTAKLTSAGPSQYFANLAVKAAQRWEFSPAQADGQPAPSAWLLHFRFKRTSTQVTPERAKR